LESLSAGNVLSGHPQLEILLGWKPFEMAEKFGWAQKGVGKF
jgi:hypothetical protein